MIPPSTPSVDAAPPPEPRETDESLVARAQQGDLAAFSEVLGRYKEEVACLLWRFTLNQAELQDLVQEVFLRLVRHLPVWSARKPFAHWLRRIAVNVGRDHCRRQGVQGRWVAQDVPPGVVEAVHDPRASPSLQAAARELKQFLAQLPADDRVLLSLYYLEDWTFGEIAEAYGWPAPLLKVKVYRAKKRLRKLLETQP